MAKHQEISLKNEFQNFYLTTCLTAKHKNFTKNEIQKNMLSSKN